MTEKDQLYVFLRVQSEDGDCDDFEMPCKTPFTWTSTRDSADAGCTWVEPFSLDGIDPKSVLVFEIRLRVPGGYYVLVYRTETKVGVLTFYKQHPLNKPQLRKARRGSIYNKASMGFKSQTPASAVSSALQLAQLCITYHAENRINYIWLCVKSIYMPAPIDRIAEIYGRTGIRMCMLIDGQNVYKAHQVLTLDNNVRIYTWTFDKDSAVTEYVAQTSINNKDWDIDGDTNSSQAIKCPTLTAKSELALQWIRTVFFPNPETGLRDKHLSILIQRADFDAVTRRITVLSPRGTREKPPLILERSVRQNVLCKVEYEMGETSEDTSVVIVKAITLSVDAYPKTVEDAFVVK